jgi:hypothetical protein
MKLPTTFFTSTFSFGPYVIRHFILFIIPFFNRENGDVSSFAQMLDNIFSPLFAVSLDPSSNPPLHYFLGTSHRTELHCVVLGCTALCRIGLHCTVSYCTALYCAALQCSLPYCTLPHSDILHCTVLHCNVAFCPHSLPSFPPPPLLISSSPPLSSSLHSSHPLAPLSSPPLP